MLTKKNQSSDLPVLDKVKSSAAPCSCGGASGPLKPRLVTLSLLLILSFNIITASDQNNVKREEEEHERKRRRHGRQLIQLLQRSKYSKTTDIKF